MCDSFGKQFLTVSPPQTEFAAYFIASKCYDFIETKFTSVEKTDFT